jgi:tRNA threonylcarbamoyladenosine biosynthesis protein TsaB
MNILAIDTSTKNFSAAVSKDGRILSSVNKRLEKTLSTSIVPILETIVKKSVKSLSHIDGFAVGLGPGSFTSLRVGLSTIKAFSMALDKPVVGISSLDVMAAAVKDKDVEVVVLSDARREMVYSCFYKKKNGVLNRSSKYALGPISEILPKIKKDMVLTGDAVKIYQEVLKTHAGKKSGVVFLSSREVYPQAKFLTALALKRFREKDVDDPAAIVPMYLYSADCQVTTK